MPFKFEWLCELLEELYKNRNKRLESINRVQNFEHQVIYNWYTRHSHRIERTGRAAIAFLSCLLPERRPDRTYNLKATRLSQIFGRALGLGSARAAELNLWRTRDGSDFGTCVEQVLRQCENNAPAPGKEVTLEEIDEALDKLAAHGLSSSLAIRAKLTNDSPTELLTPILRRLTSNEAKWFTRMLLKSFAPVQIPEYQALHGFHFMLPNLLTIQNSFEAAIDVLAKDGVRGLPARPNKEYERALQALVSEHVRPKLGVMIRRQPYHKGRSIKNCCNLANGMLMSVERKYDGEYCQIHIDMSKGHDCIQIFSKSGKDSTDDRIRLHNAIRDGLRIHRNGCKIHSRCIIEGELLVWNRTSKHIQPFHKIRKYVKHGGRELGTAQDSPVRLDEQLMIAFYDILLLDDRILLNKPQSERRQHLKAVVHTIEGQAIICDRQIINLGAHKGVRKLRDTFVEAISNRWEGLVLKPLSEPYFSWDRPKHGIKLKKDYITGMGDAADLCIVGGRRETQTELEIGAGPLKWTSFYIGAVNNMEAIRRYDAKPIIKIIDVLTHHSMPHAELLDLNKLGQFVEIGYAPTIAEFDVKIVCTGMKPPTELFKKPFIVEIMGAGFEKLSNSSTYTLRFPRKIDGKVKLHTDRTLQDTMSYSELQIMAELSLTVSGDKHSQENAELIGLLTRADGRSGLPDSVSQESGSVTTPVSAATMSLPSVQRQHVKLRSTYVRPDTEELDTQATTEYTSNSGNQSNSTSQRTVPTPTPAIRQIEQTFQNKRSHEQVDDTDDREPTSKRRREGDYDKRLPLREVIVLTSSLPTKQTGTDRRSSKQKRALDLDANFVDPFNPPAEFLAPKKRLRAADPNREHSEMEPATATSPAKSHSDNRGERGHASIPARRFAMQPLDDSVHISSNERRSIVETQSMSSAVLLTPPTSSPAQADHVSTSVPPYFHQHVILTADTAPYEGYVSPLTNKNTPAKVRQTSTANPAQVTPVLPPVLVVDTNFPLGDASVDINADFTFSLKRFMTSVHDQTQPKHHILLINGKAMHMHKNLDTLKKLRANLIDHLLSTSTPSNNDTLQSYNNCILVFDQNILTHASIVRDGFNVQTLRSLDYGNGDGADAGVFCGVVNFFELVDGLGQKTVNVGLEYSFEWIGFAQVE